MTPLSIRMILSIKFLDDTSLSLAPTLSQVSVRAPLPSVRDPPRGGAGGQGGRGVPEGQVPDHAGEGEEDQEDLLGRWSPSPAPCSLYSRM